MEVPRILALLGFALAILGGVLGESAETKAELLESYDPDIMPPSSGVFLVNASFSLLLVQELSDDVIKVDGWLHQAWRDSRLANSFQGNLRLPQHLIWTPDSAVFNAVDRVQSGWERPLAVVTSSGDVIKVDRLTSVIPCAKQAGVRHCKVKIGSWTRNGNVIDYHLYSPDIDVTQLATMTAIEVSDTSAQHNTVTYDCCPEPYHDVTFSFTLTDKVESDD